MKKGIEIKLFSIGIIIYLVGLFLLFGSAISNTNVLNKYFSIKTIHALKIVGAVMFLIGFCIFIYSLAIIYKKNYILEKNKDLVIEGKADVITFIVMYFIELLMLVICLIFDEFIGALLFGLVIIIQSVLNSFLIKYFSKGGK